MIKVTERLAILPVRHNTQTARDEVAKLLRNISAVPFRVRLAVELNEQDAYFIRRKNLKSSEFLDILTTGKNYTLIDLPNTELLR